MNSCVATPNVAVGHAVASSAIPVFSKLAELFYEPSELAFAGWITGAAQPPINSAL
jgi:hypothetical protein